MEREARHLSVTSSKSGLTKDIQVVPQDSPVCSNNSLILFITFFFQMLICFYISLFVELGGIGYFLSLSLWKMYYWALKR